MENYKNLAKVLSCVVNAETHEGVAEIEVKGKKLTCFIPSAIKSHEKLKFSMVCLSLLIHIIEKQPIKTMDISGIKTSDLSNMHIMNGIVTLMNGPKILLDCGGIYVYLKNKDNAFKVGDYVFAQGRLDLEFLPENGELNESKTR